MKNKNWTCILLLFISIISVGLFRSVLISTNELTAGTPTMTSSITFYAYVIIAVIISLAALLILKINSVKESIFNKPVKVIFNIFVLMITLPIVFLILFLYH